MLTPFFSPCLCTKILEMVMILEIRVYSWLQKVFSTRKIAAIFLDSVKKRSCRPFPRNWQYIADERSSNCLLRQQLCSRRQQCFCQLYSEDLVISGHPYLEYDDCHSELEQCCKLSSLFPYFQEGLFRILEPGTSDCQPGASF